MRGNEQMTRLKLIYIQRNKSKQQKEHISRPKSSAKYEPGLILGLQWKMEFQQITSTQNVSTTLQNAFSFNVCCYSPASSLMPAVALNVMRTLLRPRGSRNELSSRIHHPYIDLDTCMPRFKPFLLLSVITIGLIFLVSFWEAACKLTNNLSCSARFCILIKPEPRVTWGAPWFEWIFSSVLF